MQDALGDFIIGESFVYVVIGCWEEEGSGAFLQGFTYQEFLKGLHYLGYFQKIKTRFVCFFNMADVETRGRCRKINDLEIKLELI